jgi:aminopeptidase
MPHRRVQEHAELLAGEWLDIQPGDTVTVLASDPAKELVTALHAEIGKRQGEPVTLTASLDRTIGPSGEHVAAFLANHQGEFETPRHLQALVEETDVFIGIGAETNTNVLGHIPSEVQQRRAKAMGPIMGSLMGMERAVLTPHPTDAWAQRAGMSLPEYEDFVYGAMLRDWGAQDARQERMRERLEAATEARIVGPETDLRLSLDGMHAVNDIGDRNFPPGEVYTAPVVDAVEGEIRFDIPNMRQGRQIEDVHLTLEEGSVTEFSAQRNEAVLESILETDPGSDRIGEFGIGMNDDIDRVTKHISFDEKLGGTIHLALGRAYEGTVGEGREQNQSAVHFDLIKDMSGARLELDGKVVQEDGQFVWD